MQKPLALVIAIDLFLLNILLVLFHQWHWDSGATHWWLMANLFYVISIMTFHPFAHEHYVRVEQILSRTIKTVVMMYALVLTYIYIDDAAHFEPLKFLSEAVTTTVVLFYGRYFVKEFLKRYRSKGGKKQLVVFAGAGINLSYLHKIMSSDLSTGYKVLGYFENHDSTHLPEQLPRLGSLAELIPWLEQHRVNQIYCNLPNERSEEIVQIIDYCEKHFIRFFAVPNVHNYVQRSMVVKMINDMPVLTLRSEPLSNPVYRFYKRTFDVVVSFLFLVTCFWWIALIVALITKLTMPGPVFFCQKRNGYKGKVFYCLKFRSMRVNDDADRLQATLNDPRKTKWGNIMRKTNIDELPQFINVLKGDMSIVGPRPHMVKHTHQYSALIDKYMVRHWVKPGVTGWAQVRGARGETEHLWQMEARIQKDVWYIENWSPTLDLRIIYLTVRNILVGDKQAY